MIEKCAWRAGHGRGTGGARAGHGRARTDGARLVSLWGGEKGRRLQQILQTKGPPPGAAPAALTPRQTPQQLAEQVRNRDYDSSDERAQAEKKQKVGQDPRHGQSPCVLTSSP